MTISFVNASAQVAANSTPQTVSLPASVQANDWLLIFCLQSSASAVTFSPPAGYNSLGRLSDATNAMTIEVFGKLHSGSESNPSVGVSAAAAGWCLQMGAWRGGNRSAFTDATAVTSSFAAQQTFQPTGITTATDGALVISYVGTSDDNALNYNNQNSFSDRMSGANYDATTGNGSDYSVGVADIIKAAHGAQTCPTWNQSANNNDKWVGITLAMKPAIDQTATPGVLSQTLTPFAPTVTATNNKLCTVSKLSLSTTAFAPTVSTPSLATIGQLSLTTTAFAPTISTPRLATIGQLSLTLTAFAPTVSAAQSFTPPTKALGLSSFAPVVSTPRTCTPPPNSLALSGFAPTISTPRTCTPPASSLALDSFAPAVGTPQTCTPPAAALLLATFEPTIQTPVTVTPGRMAFVTSAFEPTIAIAPAFLGVAKFAGAATIRRGRGPLANLTGG